MFGKIKKLILRVLRVDWRGIFSLSNIGSVVISVAVLSVAINSSGVILKNYRLQKQIAELEQRVSVAQDEADKQRLLNQYYATDAFLDIATRRQLTRGSAGEKLIIVPKNVALTYASAPTSSETAATINDDVAKSPFRKWLDFLAGRGLPD